jgi:hypothetical protein
VHVFGQLRTAPDGQQLTAEVQFRARGSKAWTRVGSATGANARGFVDAVVRVSRSGSYRIAWIGDGASREVAVRVR